MVSLFHAANHSPAGGRFRLLPYCPVLPKPVPPVPIRRLDARNGACPHVTT
jgi:hypothetical protein